ncbi:putative long-chain-fatty-acid-coA ligase proteinputative [Leptomonas pyrrhocoris]|uniref:Putative long-chain-fatty-acid-coA ligase proteinputative n=1 Tax=Leptomonas pyrrhocoris TaxID=157538 RepID=A0A0N0VH98_LEPPY|nr:putative long-chain-fatty-acid-coA ligase proteinputative [Leptomonas pyrrhocoris]XP_015663841.1 putative long-chain-fatty-acid-coA ligase proteinputative [Leptomonas pyrrhocoris]KPA85401.1 putative long-chain-fatty-acid-coA ligase proteinputative [Leptomonas pyrrhocoris]KPA85402.1 putative long-chain-fatty-acid-coA ligase proteinputative [Leptomonas pyrrhocoris]|eukprot:XP_015663840.1 putative long-chain-fatty-acid-coA ligase proteinputative [Leptomonas pyrrhocoris]
MSQSNKVPFSSLFEHNYVLRRVFEAPPGKVALAEEFAGRATAQFTYGELQRDVVAMADVLVRRREAVAQARGGASLEWVQPSRPAHVRSVFAQGERTPSCDVMKDVGFYTTSVLGGPGYTYVVSLLASWSLNQLATPMSVSQRYNDELMYVLEHSGSSSVVGETHLLKEKLPAAYEKLYVRGEADVDIIASKLPSYDDEGKTSRVMSNTYLVDTVFDATKLLQEFRARREMRGTSALEVELLHPADSACEPFKTAEDVVRRLNDERTAAKARELDRQAEIIQQEHSARNKTPTNLEPTTDETFCFDTKDLDKLNPLFRRWYEDPASQPTKYDDCLMVYTSGTTARPKGTVHTHASVANMVKVLQDAWEWKDSDSILHVLPVHHIHGLVNILFCSLASNARCVFTKFDDASRVAHRMERGDITLFMAVPTIYTKLIDAVTRKFSPIEKTGFRKACVEHVRLMVSGSAALPVPTLNQFRELSGHTLLERYGMTEIGMALSQPLRPVEERHPGTVGSPLPTVEAYVHKPETEEAAEQAEAKESQYDEVGSLAIASESLFDRYWRNPAATKKELRTDAAGTRFFDTGDTVGVRRAAGKPAVYTILGRSSVDILKTRGYKLSALEIEAALLAHKDLFYEMAVVGTADDVLGEKVVAVVAMQPEAAKARGIAFSESVRWYESEGLTAELKKVALETLAPYKCPSRYIIVPEIPRNPTGKVNKKDLKKMLNLP